MGPPSYMRSVVDRNVVMRRMTVLSRLHISSGARHHSLPTLGTMSHSLLVTVTAVTKRAFSVRYAPYTLAAMATVVTKLCALCGARDGAKETTERREYNTTQGHRKRWKGFETAIT